MDKFTALRILSEHNATYDDPAYEEMNHKAYLLWKLDHILNHVPEMNE